MRMRHIVNCGLPRSTIRFPHYLKKKHDFRGGEKKLVDTTFVRNISHSKEKWERYDKKMYIGLHVKYPLFLSNFNETWFFSTEVRKKYLNFNFYKNLSRGEKS